MNKKPKKFGISTSVLKKYYQVKYDKRNKIKTLIYSYLN